MKKLYALYFFAMLLILATSAFVWLKIGVIAGANSGQPLLFRIWPLYLLISLTLSTLATSILLQREETFALCIFYYFLLWLIFSIFYPFFNFEQHLAVASFGILVLDVGGIFYKVVKKLREIEKIEKEFATGDALLFHI